MVKIKQIWLRGEDVNKKIEDTKMSKNDIKALKKDFQEKYANDNVYIVDENTFEIDHGENAYMFEIDIK